MKPIIKFVVQSMIVGIVLMGCGYLLVYYITKLINYYVLEAELYNTLLLLFGALVLGTIFSLLYLKPINLIARLFLKGYAIYHQEFFKQGAKYFTSGNQTKPFQVIVEVTIDEDITILGFLTNKMDDDFSVIFIPTSRRLTSGFNIIVKNKKVKETKISPEDFLKYVVTSGAHQILSK